MSTRHTRAIRHPLSYYETLEHDRETQAFIDECRSEHPALRISDGDTFGNLTIIGHARFTPPFPCIDSDEFPRTDTYYAYCACGTYIIVDGPSLRSRTTTCCTQCAHRSRQPEPAKVHA